MAARSLRKVRWPESCSCAPSKESRRTKMETGTRWGWVVGAVALLIGGTASAQDHRGTEQSIAVAMPRTEALAPRVQIDSDGPMVIYARRVEDTARFYARYGLWLPARLRPPAQRICVAPCER